MPKLSRSVSRARVLIALPAAFSVAFLAACGDDDPAWPSNAAVEDVLIQTVPQSAPYLMIQQYGDEIRLLGIPVDANGQWVDVPVTWSSSRTSLGDITIQTGADGRPYGILRFAASPSYENPTRVDTVTITASAGGRTGEVRVIIRENPRVETVGVTPVTPFLAVGAVVQLTASPRDGFGNLLPSPSPVQWATTSSSVAPVTDNGDGTATVTIGGEGNATISASVANAGEDPETGTITGTTAITVPPALTSGQTITSPPIPADGTRSWTIQVPPGATSLVAQISNGVGGDADIYVFSPGTIPNSPTLASNFTCRPWLFGSNETCTINNPAAGTWGIRIHAYPDDGDITSVDLRVTVN